MHRPIHVLLICRAYVYCLIAFQGNFSLDDHISAVCAAAAQSFYAIKILKNSGLQMAAIEQVFHAIVLSKITYASPAWWGFASASNKQRLQAVLNKAIRWGFYSSSAPSFEEICARKDTLLFNNVLSNPNHVLHHLLPPVKVTSYNLRGSTTHGRILPTKHSSNQGRNYIFRMLFNDLPYR